MATRTRLPGVTFDVDPVLPATMPLKEESIPKVVRRLLDSDIESCSDHHSNLVVEISYHPLLAAVYKAFAEHRPLVLSPDAVWITIAQGVAHHMAIHGERLRDRFVAHQGKLDLTFTCSDWVEGSPENPWNEAFAAWSGQIREHVGDELHDALVCDFSTTGPIERAVSQIVLMDVVERYFHYNVYCICGIPSVTLEGAPADWERLREKVSRLELFDINWWLDHLKPICDQFVSASRGEPDVGHWRDICKLQDAYGGHEINGWVAKLFPYLRSYIKGPCRLRNPIFETGEGFQTFVAPPGLSRVPFEWRNLVTGITRSMEAIGGLVGVSQDRETLALRPKVGWVVRKAELMDVILGRLRKEHKTHPAIREPAEQQSLRERYLSQLPPDVEAFYHAVGGAELFGTGAGAACRIVARSEMKALDWNEAPQTICTRGRDGCTWHRFAELADGAWLAINEDRINGNSFEDDPALNARRYEDESFAPICVVSEATQGKAGRNPVIALSFSDFLKKFLDADGQFFWNEVGYSGYGDADRFTRRD